MPTLHFFSLSTMFCPTVCSLPFLYCTFGEYGAGPDLAGGGPGAQLTWGH